MNAPGNFVIGVAAEEFEFSLRPPRNAGAVGNAEMPSPTRNGLDGAIEPPRNFLVWRRAEQANVCEFPFSDFVLNESRNAQINSLVANGVFRASEPPREFQIGEAAKHSDFAGCPAAGRRWQVDASALALGDDFFDGASGAVGEDGVGRFAESFQFGRGPRCVAAGLLRGPVGCGTTGS